MHLQTITAVIVSLAATMTSSIPLNKRIVNGTPVKEGELPMFAQISGCGGTLIGPQVILTDHPINYRKVYLNSVEREKGKLVKPVRAVGHPEYNGKVGNHDIGLVFLPEKVDGPYGLIEGTSYPDEGSTLTVAGFGACHGDSGGPLYTGSGKDVRVVGLVSGAGKEDRCGEKGTFQYYMFVKPFIPWIKAETEKFEKDGVNLTAGADAKLKSHFSLEVEVRAQNNDRRSKIVGDQPFDSLKLPYTTAITSITTSGAPLSKRILNGTPVQKGELPAYALGLQELYPDGSFAGGCGGVLIGPQAEKSGDIYIGGVVVNTGEKLAKFVKSVQYPGFNASTGTNDIGLVFLQEKVDGPYALIEGTSYPEEGSKLMVAGNGGKSESYNLVELTSSFPTTNDHRVVSVSATEVGGGLNSSILLKVEVTIGSKAECHAHKNGRLVFDPNTQICATDNGYSACVVDSGSPLYSGSGNDTLVVGLVSGSGNVFFCGEKGAYQYFTFVKSFIPWIKAEIEKFEMNETNSVTKIDANM
ncbi:hypothetical protein EC968_000189 [Mortierella alpina]|nr:hypothetical protein EC968_000189 [Mortierella alpina]